MCGVRLVEEERENGNKKRRSERKESGRKAVR